MMVTSVMQNIIYFELEVSMTAKLRKKMCLYWVSQTPKIYKINQHHMYSLLIHQLL